MIVGAGKMSELAARHLRRSGATQIFVTNRTHERAVEMAQLFDGKIVEYTHFMSFLPEVDIVIASSGAPHYIIVRDDMKKVIEARRNRPMFLIDIAVPRNIEPSVNKLDNVFLYDIDDLQKVVETNLDGRMHSAEEAEAIIREEVDRMMARLKTREVVPTIVSLAGTARTVCAQRSWRACAGSSEHSRPSRNRRSKRSPRASSTRSRTGPSRSCGARLRSPTATISSPPSERFSAWATSMLTIGSRGSQLALWQARWIQARLQGFGVECRLEIIHTTGDKITDVALSKVGTKGLFTKEIEEALLERGDRSGRA